jgi:tRNA (mo5U34)-methyltransferase
VAVPSLGVGRSRRDELERRVRSVEWFHSIDLGNGIVTPGRDPSASRLATIQLPDDLTGMTVLDVGAWDGFFSFEAERRGAERVLAVDSFSWDGGGWGSRNGFDLAREALGSRVEYKAVEVLDLSPETVGVFDLVLFLGVLYHMRHPLLALERIASVTRKQLILETHVDLIGLDRPAAAFYPNEELNADASNWWGPNPAAVEAMLRTVGFATVDIVQRPRSFPYSVGRALRRRRRGRDPVRRARDDGRMTAHAFR